MHRVGRLNGVVVLVAWGILASSPAFAQAPRGSNAKEPWDWFTSKVKGFVGAPLDPRRPSLPPAYPGAAKRFEARQQQAQRAPARGSSPWQPQKDPTITAIKEWVGEPLSTRPRPPRSTAQHLDTAGREPTRAEPTPHHETMASFDDLEEIGGSAKSYDARSEDPAWRGVTEWVGDPQVARPGVRRNVQRHSVRPASATRPQEERPPADPMFTTIKQWVGEPLDPYSQRRLPTQPHPRARMSQTGDFRRVARSPNASGPRRAYDPYEYEPIEDRTVDWADERSSPPEDEELPGHLSIMQEIFHGSPSSSAASRSLGNSRRTKPPR